MEPNPPAQADVFLCSVRGGKRSAKTFERAVSITLEHQASLVLLFIVDVDFLGYATVARVKLMVSELMETGRFALSVLAEKAHNQGIVDVKTVIREGRIQDVISEVAKQTQATKLIIGQPVKVPGIPSFAVSDFQKMLAALRDQQNMEIICVE